MNDSKDEEALHDGRLESDIHHKAKKAVLYATRNWVSHRDIGLEDLSVVWFSKDLPSWKILLHTNQHYGKYYEVTYNGVHDVVFVDVYQKHAPVNFMGEALDNFHI